MNAFAALVLAQVAVPVQHATPVLEFPEPGVDDSAAYEGYRTRFVRDAAGNAVQVYIKEAEGRVVHLWADAANASAGFTARDVRGRPARLAWGSDGVGIGADDGTRFVEYGLAAPAEPVEIGAFLLGSMRVERDFQHVGGHLRPFPEAAFEPTELVELIGHVERLEEPERGRHLAALRASSPTELRSRLRATVRAEAAGARASVRVEQPTFDGRNLMWLELTVEEGRAAVDAERRTVSIRPRGDRPIRLTVRIGTDHDALGPLRSEDMFNADFLAYYERVRAEARPEPVVGSGGGAAGGAGRAAEAGARFRRLDRQVRSLELVSYEEKLMAGLPNYATYFGRDMIMSALMMEPIWSTAMIEHVVAGVLRKLAPTGAVSHEEALGGQAIREHAANYNGLMSERRRLLAAGRAAAADSALASARAILASMQEVRENYHMVDDDFQFPVLAARYLANPDIPRERKRAFLLADAAAGAESRLERLLRNLAFVVRRADAYARDPVPANLIGFERRPDGRWYASSWRDSGAGYANGRYAMDVNAIWVPEALAATERILAALAAAGFAVPDLAARHADSALDPLWEYARDRARFRSALETWRGVGDRFAVTLGAADARGRIAAWLAWLPAAESAYWRSVLEATPIPAGGVRFAALSLDGDGRPIPVVNTDPAMRLFLEDLTGAVLEGRTTADRVLAELEPFVLPYPVGLFVPGLGPLVANDAYAPPAVWQAFREDHYHSPLVVWGREVNLLKLGLARQIAAAYDDAGELRDHRLAPYVARLADALDRVVEAVEASGFKDNELWTYRIANGRLSPLRYGISTDIQLWNLTDLAVQFVLGRLPADRALSRGEAERPAAGYTGSGERACAMC